MPKQLHQLELLRLQRDWSYQALADEIHAVTGYRRDQDCWRKICQQLTGRPHRPTVYAIEQFLDAVIATNGKRRKGAA